LRCHRPTDCDRTPEACPRQCPPEDKGLQPIGFSQPPIIAPWRIWNQRHSAAGSLHWRRLRPSRSAIDNATRPAYVQVLTEEQQITARGILLQALSWFNRKAMQYHQVMRDSGSAHIYKALAKRAGCLALSASALGITHPVPTTKSSGSSRPSARNWLTRCRSRTLSSETPGGRDTCRPTTESGSNQPSVPVLLSSGAMSCSADQRGESNN